MKEGYIIKNVSSAKINDSDLKLINNYTRRDYTADEIYTFSVVLCDNEIDRDYECFTKDALEKLAELFVGKTGIFDHSMESKDQTARIFSCAVELVEGSLNSQGKDYYRLVAKAYLPLIDKNNDLIAEIDSGIKREVSVNCGVKKNICSICGKDIKNEGCRHVKGKFYGQGNNKNLCYVILDEPVDAYEWSFVAVPAQRGAGVIKSHKLRSPRKLNQSLGLSLIVDKLNSDSDVVLNSLQAKKVYDFISELKALSDDGAVYREDLKNEVVRLGMRVFPSLNSSTMAEVGDLMSIEQLKQFKLSFLSKINGSNHNGPQLFNDKNDLQINNTQFKI